MTFSRETRVNYRMGGLYGLLKSTHRYIGNHHVIVHISEAHKRTIDRKYKLPQIILVVNLSNYIEYRDQYIQ